MYNTINKIKMCYVHMHLLSCKYNNDLALDQPRFGKSCIFLAKKTRCALCLPVRSTARAQSSRLDRRQSGKHHQDSRQDTTHRTRDPPEFVRASTDASPVCESGYLYNTIPESL